MLAVRLTTFASTPSSPLGAIRPTSLHSVSAMISVGPVLAAVAILTQRFVPPVVGIVPDHPFASAKEMPPVLGS